MDSEPERAVITYLHQVNADMDRTGKHKFIAPTAIPWLADGMLRAARAAGERLQAENAGSSIDDRLADVYDAAGAYLTACDQVDNADTGRSSLEAICRRDAAFAELRAARYPEQDA